MDAQSFLDNLGAIAEAPGGIDRIREVVLDLSLAGMLVQPSTDDEPVDALIERLASDREKTIQKWGFREQKLRSPISSDDQPYGVPANWTWVRLAEVAHPQAGFAFKSNGFNEIARGLPLVRIRDIGTGETECFFDGDFREEFVIDQGDYLVGMDGNFNIRRWEGARALLNQRVTRLVFFGDEVARPFVVWALQREINKLHGSRAYTTVQHLSGKQIARAMIPLPPLAEQQRIVAKVDELVQLCDDLEARQQCRHHATTRLRSSSLNALTNAETDDDLHAAWSRIHTNWGALTDRPDSIDALRQAILQLAFQGRLALQDPRDEPAQQMLEGELRLPTGYRRRRKILKKSRAVRLPQPMDAIPASWAWSTVHDLYDLNAIVDYADGNHGSLYPRSTEFGEVGVTFVTAKNLTNGTVDWDSCAFLDEQRAKQLVKGWAQAGDVLLTHNATVGRVARVEASANPFLLGTSVTFYRLNPAALDRDFFFYLLRSPLWQSQLRAVMVQTTRNQVSIQKQALFRIPVPPINEQRRISARLDSLMALCDNLEQGLASLETAGRRILQTRTVPTAGAVSEGRGV